MTAPPRLTDTAALTRNRARALSQAARAGTPPARFLHDAAIAELQDRLAMVNKTFTDVAVVTGHPEIWGPAFPGARLLRDADLLELTPGAHDLVIHAMALHWANDPVGQVIQCARALRPDGLFLAVALGGQTLAVLRATLAEAEVALTGGLSPRVAPMAEVRDMGALLQRAGLALPVADALPLTASYSDFMALLHDIRAMGEANALADRLRRPTRAGVFRQAARLYSGAASDQDGRLLARFDLIVLTGWSPADSQPRPLRPGSAQARLAETLGVKEIPLGD